MTQIQINGQKFNMAYNLRTAITYEQMTGHNPLDFEHFQQNQMTNSATLAYCMLISNNDNVPDFDEFTRLISDLKTMNEVLTSAAKEMQDFFMPTEAEVKKAKKEKGKKAKKEGDSKN